VILYPFHPGHVATNAPRVRGPYTLVEKLGGPAVPEKDATVSQPV
jgi:hypothetical protein